MIRLLLVLAAGCGGPAAAPSSAPPPAVVRAPSAPAPVDPRFAEAASAALRSVDDGYAAERVAVVLLDARTGRLLAAVGRGPHGDDDAFRVGPAGSTFKPITIAAALDAGLDPAARFDGAAWGELRDAHPRPWVDARGTLVHSSNVGAARVMEAVGARPVVDLVDRLALRRAWRVGERTADAPEIPEVWVGAAARRLAGGIDVDTTPLHLAVAYAALANGGELVEPTEDGTGARRRVLSREAAAETLAYLEAAVSGEGTGHRAAVDGLRVAGKTGTTHLGAGADRRWVALFAGVAPADDPSWVAVIRVVGRAETFGGAVAAPAFHALAARLR